MRRNTNGYCYLPLYIVCIERPENRHYFSLAGAGTSDDVIGFTRGCVWLA
jgi:hypothetical protein